MSRSSDAGTRIDLKRLHEAIGASGQALPERSGLRGFHLEDLATAVHAGLEVDVVRSAKLARILVLDIGRGFERVGRAAHAAARRRGLSFRNGHGSSPVVWATVKSEAPNGRAPAPSVAISMRCVSIGTRRGTPAPVSARGQPRRQPANGAVAFIRTSSRFAKLRWRGEGRAGLRSFGFGSAVTRSAASWRERSRVGLPKARCAAASTPKTPGPHSAMLR